MAADKQHAHELIEQLAPSQVPAAIGILERLLDPVARAIANARIDDEPLTPEDEKALAEARESSKRKMDSARRSPRRVWTHARRCR